MAETGNRRTRTEGSERPRSGTSSSSNRAAPRGSSSDALIELAEQIEEHGRALLARARDLRRMAESGGEGAPPRKPMGQRSGGYGGSRAGGSRSGGGERPPRRASERGGSGERSRSPRPGGSGERSRSSRGDREDVPDWAPTPKKRRT